MKRTLIVVVVGACVALVSVGARFVTANANGQSAGSDQYLLQIVLEGCRQAASAVHTGRGEVTIDETTRIGGGDMSTKKTYHLLFSRERFNLDAHIECLANAVPHPVSPEMLSMPGTAYEYRVAYDGSAVTKFVPAKGAAIVSTADYGTGHTELLGYREDFAPSLYGAVDITTLHAQLPPDSGYTPSSTHIVGRETVAGDECIVVELAWTNTSVPDVPRCETWHFWVDPAKGYAVPRVRKWKQGGLFSKKTLVEEIDVELREHSTGIWVPLKVVHNSYRLDKQTRQPYPRRSKTVEYSTDFTINGSVTDAEFKPALPSGTKVYDELLEADYTVP